MSMSVKDYLVKVLSVRSNTPLKTVEAVVDFQMQGAHDALVKNNSIELSGFGKFFYNIKKAQKKLDLNIMKKTFYENALNAPDLSEQKTKSLRVKLENTINTIESIKPKLNGIQADSRRLEEQIDSLLKSKGLNRASSEGENSTM